MLWIFFGNSVLLTGYFLSYLQFIMLPTFGLGDQLWDYTGLNITCCTLHDMVVPFTPVRGTLRKLRIKISQRTVVGLMEVINVLTLFQLFCVYILFFSYFLMIGTFWTRILFHLFRISLILQNLKFFLNFSWSSLIFSASSYT